ncbi:MAG: hypothetical protein KDD70_01710 [Bdellovibrionales bacterium]|nr:hypothetical protein [Bdellovibrionales bacterium]
MSRYSILTWIMGCLFIIPGLLLVRTHMKETGLPLLQQEKKSDLIQLSVLFEAPQTRDDQVKRREFRFLLPEESRYWRVVDEQINSRKFSLVILKEDDRRVGILSTRSDRNQELSAEYRLTLEKRKTPLSFPTDLDSIQLKDEDLKKFKKILVQHCVKATELTAERSAECIPNLVRSLRSAELKDWLQEATGLSKLTIKDFARVIAMFLSHQDLPAYPSFAAPLSGFQSSIELRHVIFFVAKDKTELLYDFRTERIEPARNYFSWGGQNEILKSERALDDIRVSLASAVVSSPDVAIESFSSDNTIIRYLSLQRLPLSSQALFELTLLLPLAALAVCVIRNFIGLVTFGTFMPALLGLSFLQTGVVPGILLTLFIVGAGCVARIAADWLHMLLVPRLAAVLTTVMILFYIITQISFDLSWDPGLQVTLFPIIVLTMMVERLTIILDELGLVTALGRLVSTIISAIACFAVLSQEEIQYLFFTFPEFNLVVLGVAIIFGRYTGYRLTELIRFREFGQEVS